MRRHALALVITALLIPLTPSPANAADRSMPGTAWGDGEVMVDSTVSTAAQNALRRSGVRVIRLQGELRVLIAGGQSVFGTSSRCSSSGDPRTPCWYRGAGGGQTVASPT